jgi:hypothetical protein
MENERAKNKIIPDQKKGSETGAEHIVETASGSKARSVFENAKRRLQSISEWPEYCAVSAMKTALTDREGNEVKREPQLGDYIRIDLAGPGPRSGEGYDWVRVEEIIESGNADEEEQLYGIQVRPASAPVNSDKDTSHFYTSEATSTFIVERKGLLVKASETGKNEVPNVETDKMADKVRNTLVAAGGMAGLSGLQWKMLMKGLLEGN